MCLNISLNLLDTNWMMANLKPDLAYIRVELKMVIYLFRTIIILKE